MKTFLRATVALAVACFLFFLPDLVSALPERPMLSPEMQEKQATHIVEGTVTRVYECKEKDGKWRVTYFVAEVDVDKVTKGEGIDTNEKLFVRWFSRYWDGGQPPTDSSGHYGWAPKKGQKARMFLSDKSGTEYRYYSEDGGLKALIPNGFAKVD